MSNPPFADIAAANIGPKERICVNGGAPGLSSGPCASGKTLDSIQEFRELHQARVSCCADLDSGLLYPIKPMILMDQINNMALFFWYVNIERRQIVLRQVISKRVFIMILRDQTHCNVARRMSIRECSLQLSYRFRICNEDDRKAFKHLDRISRPHESWSICIIREKGSFKIMYETI